MQCCLHFSMMRPEIVGEKMEPERFYDAVNYVLSLQVRSEQFIFATLSFACIVIKFYTFDQKEKKINLRTSIAYMK